MKKRISIILVVVLLFSICVKNVSASELCSSKGYTVMTINGIFTDENGAIQNKENLKRLLKPTYNNQPLTIDYLYNATHLGGAMDLVDVLAQAVIDQNTDYDFEEMLNDASQKVTTQKLLLVGHSQGNFYANNFYDEVASKPGGVPSQSIGVYGVATPANRVAGGGKYLTSDTDSIINSVITKVLIYVLAPNIHIPLQKSDGTGHDFSNVYLKYQGDRIVSDIKSSLNNLQNNDEQESGEPCISPPELTAFHKVQGAILTSADFVVNNTKKAVVYVVNGVYNTGATVGSVIYNTTLSIGKVVNGLFANAINSLPDTNSVAAILPGISVGSLNNTNVGDKAAEATPPRPTVPESVPATASQNIAITDSVKTITSTTESMPPSSSYSGNGGGGSSSGGSNSGGSGGSNGGGGDNSGGGDNNNSDSNNDNNNDGDPPIEDKIAPVISIVGESSIDVTKGTTYTDSGATALDEKDGVIDVVITGDVDTAIVSVYTITYTATDLAKNISTVIRTINVVEEIIPDTTAPVISVTGANPIDIIQGTVYTDLGATALDEVDGVREVASTGVVDINVIGVYTITYTASDLSDNIATAVRTVNVLAPAPDITPPVITVNGNINEVITTNSTYVDAGATALDNVDGVRTVEVTGTVDSTRPGDNVITYTASDVAGNVGTATRTVTVATYKYIPKYSFGKNNGDNHNWQVWIFNGSNVYDWSDVYVDNYLHEQFKMQTYPGGYWCSSCLQRGIFKHDPRKGFEPTDISMSGLENSPQNKMNGITYEVIIQWDSTGYTYTISHDNIVDSTSHTNVANMNNNLWTGWDGSSNNFQTFPSGTWYDASAYAFFPSGYTSGGGGMILQPYPIYKDQSVSAISSLSLPNKGLHIGKGINRAQGRTNLTAFTFQVVYADKNNNAPQNVKLQVTNVTTGISLPEVEMQKISEGADVLSDGSFLNGETYLTNNILYDTGDYDYYFTANDSAGNLIRIPESVTLNFGVIPSTYTYLPKYSFGTNNGDGRDWQAWAFNGSNVYDWSDVYVGYYLKEQFKMQAYPGGYWCGNCLQRGIFNHDPQKGFETTDRTVSSLENSPQNRMNGVTYDVIIEWDSTGYTYTIAHSGITDVTGHTNVVNVSGDMWVGWDGSSNNFQTFPSGGWYNVSDYAFFPPDHTGGGSGMILQPYPVYDGSQALPLSSSKAIITFNFASLASEVVGVVDETDNTVALTVPFGTNVTTLVPTVAISPDASISPNTNVVQDFTNSVTYIVTARDGSTQNYIVTVTVDSDPNKDIIPPIISALSLSPSPIFGYAKIGDTITLSITADSAGYTAQTISINNVAATNFTDKGNGAYTAIYIVSSLNNDVTSGTIPVSVVLTDAAGNSNEAYTTVTANALQIDAHAPTLVSAKVMTATSIDVTFSEDIDGNTVNTSGNEFTVSGHTVTKASELEGVITLTLSTNIGAGETLSVTFESANFKDLAGNQAVNPITVTATNSL